MYSANLFLTVITRSDFYAWMDCFTNFVSAKFRQFHPIFCLLPVPILVFTSNMFFLEAITSPILPPLPPEVHPIELDRPHLYWTDWDGCLLSDRKLRTTRANFWVEPKIKPVTRLVKAITRDCRAYVVFHFCVFIAIIFWVNLYVCNSLDRTE